MKKIVIYISLLLSYSVHGLELQTGLNGPWHNPQIPSQGLVIHIIPESNQVFIAWFTYTEQSDQQMWLTAQGSLASNPIELTIYKSTEGALNNNAPPASQVVWGSGSLLFNSCTAAKFTYAGSVSGDMDLVPITSPIACVEGGP